VGTPNLVEAASTKNVLGGDVLLIVGRDFDSLKHRFDLLPRSASASSTSVHSTTSTQPVLQQTTTTTATTTTTTVAHRTVDTRFVPVDPKTGAALVGCPRK
jgi:hypothetical protein